MTARDIDDDHLKLLRRELLLSGINLGLFFPWWARPKAVRESILRELLVTMEAPVHEGLIPPYGSVIVPKDADLGPLLPLQDKDLELARKAADGSSALVVFRESSFAGLLLLDQSGVPDLQLAQIAESFDGIALRRDRTGVVRLYGPIGSLRHAGRQWTASPLIGEAVNQIYKAAPMVDLELLKKLLIFAYYVLSPWHIGATLVWLLSESDAFKESTDLRPLRLSISPEPGEPSLAFAAHLLAQYDGATSISRTGEIQATGIHLVPSRKAEELIPRFAGTRHTSARRASFDLSNALVITVSADGPVTIFSDGLSIFELWWFSAEASALQFLNIVGKEHEDNISSSMNSTVCSRCGKTSEVEVLTIIGWKGLEEAHCPVCGEVIAEEMCFTIHANIKKVF